MKIVPCRTTSVLMLIISGLFFVACGPFRNDALANKYCKYSATIKVVDSIDYVIDFKGYTLGKATVDSLFLDRLHAKNIYVANDSSETRYVLYLKKFEYLIDTYEVAVNDKDGYQVDTGDEVTLDLSIYSEIVDLKTQKRKEMNVGTYQVKSPHKDLLFNFFTVTKDKRVKPKRTLHNHLNRLANRIAKFINKTRKKD